MTLSIKVNLHNMQNVKFSPVVRVTHRNVFLTTSIVPRCMLGKVKLQFLCFVRVLFFRSKVILSCFVQNGFNAVRAFISMDTSHNC